MDEKNNLPATQPETKTAPVEDLGNSELAAFGRELFTLDRALRAQGLSIRELISDLARHRGVSV